MRQLQCNYLFFCWLQPGDYTISVSADDFGTQTKNLSVKQNGVIDTDFKMIPIVIIAHSRKHCGKQSTANSTFLGIKLPVKEKKKGTEEILRFTISAIAVHPTSKKLYLISSADKYNYEKITPQFL